MKKIIYTLVNIVIMLLLFTGCISSSTERKSFVVVESSGPFFNAEDVNVLADNILEIKAGNFDYLLVDDSGKNITKSYIDNFPDTKEEIKNYLIDHYEEKRLTDLPVESFRIVEKDKYRVTNWKKEIDKFYKGDRLISQVTRDKDDMLIGPPSEEEIREKFIRETETLYNEKNYEKIINHIKTNEYIIYSMEDIKGLSDLR